MFQKKFFNLVSQLIENSKNFHSAGGKSAETKNDQVKQSGFSYTENDFHFFHWRK